MNTKWTTRTGDEAAARRAGGRRRINSLKKRRMWERRFRILKMLAMVGDLPRGGQRQLAERFDVDRSVISRDLAWVRSTGYAGLGVVPRCSYRRRRVTVEYEYGSTAVVRSFLTKQIARAFTPLRRADEEGNERRY